MTVTVYKSTDTGAPTLSGGQNLPDLARLLQQVLVNGYGTAATGTITSNNTNVSDGDTVTVGSRVYTFRNAPSQGYDVQIGGNADASLTSLQKAINASGVIGTDYYTGTYISAEVSCSGPTAHVLTITALFTGTTGNSLALAKSAATLTVSGATLSGGTVTKTAAGWSCPYQQNNTPSFHFASTPTTNAGATTSGSHTLSGSNSVGDLLILVVAIYDAVAGTATVTTPAGWTRLVNRQAFGRLVTGSPGEALYVYSKIAVSADIGGGINLTASSTVSWQVTSFGTGQVDNSGQPQVVASQAASGATIASPSAIINDNNSHVISIACVNSGASLTDTPPAGYTSRISANYVAGANEIFVATKDSVASGTTGALTHTPSGTPANTSAMVTLVVKGLTNSQIVLRPGSGVQHYFHVDDQCINLTTAGAAGREAQFRGSEGASGFQAGITNYFPTTAQIALSSGMAIRKSTTADLTTRAWVIVADDRTAIIQVLSGDSAGAYYGAYMGEIYSIMSSTDSYRSMAIGRGVANSASNTQEFLWTIAPSLTAGQTSHYLARSYTALGGSINVAKFADIARGNGNSSAGADGAVAPNGPDGKVHLSPIHLAQVSPIHIRGRMRGMFQICHPPTGFTDGDTITGAGAYAGRTFLVFKGTYGGGATQGMGCIDITGPWETN